MSNQVKYLWPHSVAELVTNIAQGGQVIEFFHEFRWSDRPMPFLIRQDERTWVMPPRSTAELPLFLSLRARRPR